MQKSLQLQLEHPNRGDWGSTCLNDLKELEINLSLQEIRTISKSSFTNILKDRTKRNALAYLIGKKGKKGKEICYSTLEMSEYLQPTNQVLTVEQKREMFSVRNRMIDIPNNFPGRKEHNQCVCGETEEMTHIYNCEMLKKGETELTYEKI